MKLRVDDDNITIEFEDTEPLVCEVRKHKNIHPRCYGKVYRAIFLDSEDSIEVSTYCLGEIIMERVNNFALILILKNGKWTPLNPVEKLHTKKRGKK